MTKIEKIAHEVATKYGLKIERGYYDSIVLVREGRGVVSIDPEMRGYELGCVPIRKRGQYAGRKWMERLFEDGAAALAKLDP